MKNHQSIAQSQDTSSLVSTSSISAQLHLPLYPQNIPQFRGAIIAAAGFEKDLLHNHNNQPNTKSDYYYRYPLVQYRSQKGKAVMMGFGAGVHTVKQVLLNTPYIYTNKQKIALRIENLQEREHKVQILPQARLYRLMDWVALGKTNYIEWKDNMNLVRRVQLLERVLLSHIMTFARGIEWHIAEKLSVELVLINKVKKVKIHDAPAMAFNILFKSNALLPEGIGLGKSVSIGYGVCQSTRYENT